MKKSCGVFKFLFLVAGVVTGFCFSTFYDAYPDSSFWITIAFFLGSLSGISLTYAFIMVSLLKNDTTSPENRRFESVK